MVRLLYETIQFSPFVWDGDVALATQFEAAAAAGFDGVGVDVWSVDRHLAHGGTVRELTDALDRVGLRCVELQALVLNDEMPPISRPPLFVELVDAFRPEIVMSGFPTMPTDADIDTFRRAVDQVSAHGATVALEFLPMMPIDTIAKTLDIVRRVDGPVGVCVDTWHFFRGPDTWAELEALTAADLAYIQFNDALPLVSDDLMSETLQRRTLPGEGEFDLTRFCEIVRTKGYDGPVAVEIMSAPLRAEGAHEYARKAEAAARPYWP
ncbi:MAG TPA: sugar phosphate isomerase/epimerase [Acidimicrobiales bacterium]|nr:sugar phosphate isomerase/epimerase [Acidimicrobiales bacterium]